MSADLDIETFAALVAELESPFALRRALLAGHKLTPAAFGVIQQRWIAELMAHPEGPAHARFSAVYATMCAALRSAEAREGRSIAPGAFGAELILADTEKLPDAPSDEPSGTAELDGAALAAAALPFGPVAKVAEYGDLSDGDETDHDATLPMAGASAHRVSGATRPQSPVRPIHAKKNH